MTDKANDSGTTSKSVIDWLTTVSGIAGILFNILSLFLEEKSAKQFAFGLAFIIPIGSFWYQRQRTNQLKITPSSESNSVNAANRILKKYLTVYKADRGMRIPFNRLRWIEKYASQKLLKSETARDLISTSRSVFYWISGTNLTLGLMLLVTLYAFLTTNYEFNPIDYAFGRDNVQEENPFIALDKGGGVMVFGSGTPDLTSGEQPLNENMPIGDFAIQLTEVTNRQFRVCRRAGGCKLDPIPSPDSPRYYEGSEYDDYPVVGVNAFQSQEFCHWLGGDIPTSEQWERAARGLHGRPWPWLDENLTPDRANLYQLDGSSELAPAKDFPAGASPEGILNLVGNAAEWTRTVLFTQDDGETFSLENWNGAESQVALAVRGGSWGFQMSRITESQLNLPGDFGVFTGFRCAITK